MRNNLGRIGESLVAKLLSRKGFSIQEKNFWKKWGEIDVIADDGKVLHFVEVKTVSCENLETISRETGYRPEDNVHPEKLKRLGRTIQSYLLENKREEGEWQFDVAAVFYEEAGKRAKIRMLWNVVL